MRRSANARVDGLTPSALPGHTDGDSSRQPRWRHRCRRGPRFGEIYQARSIATRAAQGRGRPGQEDASAVMAMTVNGVGVTIQDRRVRVRKFLGLNIGNSAYIRGVPRKGNLRPGESANRGGEA